MRVRNYQDKRDMHSARLCEGFPHGKFAFLAAFALIFALIMIPSADAIFPTKSYDDINQEYTLNDWLGFDEVAKVKLLTPQRMACSNTCYGILEITTDNNINDKFLWNFFDEHNVEVTKGEGLIDYKIEIFDGYEDVMKQTYEKLYNKTNDSYYNSPTGKYEDTGDDREVWLEFDYNNVEFAKDGTYTIKISGSKNPEDTIDWIPTILGHELDAFAWWDAETRRITHNDTISLGETGSMVTGYDGYGLAYGGRYLAQTINNTGDAFNLTQIQLRLQKRNPTGDLTLSIYTNNASNHPETNVYSCDNIEAADFPGDQVGTWVNKSCYANGGYIIEANTNYSIVVENTHDVEDQWYQMHVENPGSNPVLGWNFNGDSTTNWVGGHEGNANVRDWFYVLWGIDVVIPSPEFEINSPMNITYNTSAIVDLNVTNTTNPMQNWWYDLNGAGGVSFTPNTTITGIEGLNTLFVYGNSSDVGTEVNGTAGINFTISTAPEIRVASPLNQTYNTANILINVTSNKTASFWWYSLNSGANVTFTPNSSFTAAEGSNTLDIYANSTITNAISVNSTMFLVDTIAPVITIISPIATLYSDLDTMQFNYSYLEANPSVVWYCLTNLTTSCVNVTTTVNISGLQINDTTNYLLVCINDTINRIACDSVVFDAYTIESPVYNTDTAEFSTESFYNFIKLNQSRIVPQVYNFTWNNTLYDSSFIEETTGENATRTLLIPAIPSEADSVNISFQWNFSLNYTPTNTLFTSNTSFYTQNVSIFSIDDCTTNNVLIYNFSFFDELNRTQPLINYPDNNITIDLALFMGDFPDNVKNYTIVGDSVNQSYYEVCMNTFSTQQVDATLKFDTPSYETRHFKILNRTTISGGDNITTYGIHTANAGLVPFLIHIIDENGESIPTAYINIRKEIPIDSGNFINITWGMQPGDDDVSKVDLVPEIMYYFQFWDDYKMIGEFKQITHQTNLYFEIVPSRQFSEYGEARDVMYNISFNNVTNITRYEFNAANIPVAEFNNTCLKVTKKNLLLGNTEICNICFTDDNRTGALECDITSGGSGTYEALMTITRTATEGLFGSRARTFNIDIFNFDTGLDVAHDYFKDGGLIISIMVISVMVMLAVVSPPAAMILGLFGFVMCYAMGLIDIGWTFVVGLCVVGGILIMKVRGGGGI